MKIRIFVVLALLASVASAQVITDTRPATRHEAITPNDSTTLVDSQGRLKYRAIYIEGAGDVSITDCVPSGGVCSAGATVVYTVPAGTLMPFAPYRVNSTATTASGITGWW